MNYEILANAIVEQAAKDYRGRGRLSEKTQRMLWRQRCVLRQSGSFVPHGSDS